MQQQSFIMQIAHAIQLLNPDMIQYIIPFIVTQRDMIASERPPASIRFQLQPII